MVNLASEGACGTTSSLEVNPIYQRENERDETKDGGIMKD